MKIACLQFSPSLGHPLQNIQKANSILAGRNDLQNLDLLVLPELALTGYNFPSLAAINPFLEPTAAGLSTQWARETASRLGCVVCIGYPEVASNAAAPATPSLDPLHLPPLLSAAPSVLPVLDGPVREEVKGKFNAVVVVAPDGRVLAHYRKSFLYYTDVRWAEPGGGFEAGVFELPPSSLPSSAQQRRKNRASHKAGSDNDAVPNHESERTSREMVRATLGICMDINPRNFTAPWSSYEYATHVHASGADIAILSMAWLSHSLTSTDVLEEPHKRQPDQETLGYWVERFRPVVVMGDGRGGGGSAQRTGTLLVMANRAGVEGEVCYAGTSTVMRVGRGQVVMWGVLGKGEEGCLVVDTETKPRYVFGSGPRDGRGQDDVEGRDGQKQEDARVGMEADGYDVKGE